MSEDRKPLVFVKPPKPLGEMTDQEIKAWSVAVWKMFRQACVIDADASSNGEQEASADDAAADGTSGEES